MKNIIHQTHQEWHPILEQALSLMDAEYLHSLKVQDNWLPGIQHLFAAFTLPLSQVNYILLGESPYPREKSANGYAFWDGAVGKLWSETGLTKEVNRATSLRNFIKMLLYARGNLDRDFSQPAVAAVDKTGLVQTAPELFHGLLHKGILLLNATLVFSKGQVNYHARFWRPFIHSILDQLAEKKPTVQLILFGRIASQIPKTSLSAGLISEHPYNISFITNPEVVEFFKPLDLLTCHEK